jgi:hypothetical protein
MNVLQEKARQRLQARIRPDEVLMTLVAFERSLYPTGNGRSLPGPDGFVAVTDLRVILAETNSRGSDTSHPHPTTIGAQLETRFIGPSVLTLNAGPLGIMTLVGSRRDMKYAAEEINQRAGQAIPSQPEGRLVPNFPPSQLICSDCFTEQQHRWDPSPSFCHGCLRTFTWTDAHRQLVNELRACFQDGKGILELPQHLRDWALAERRNRSKGR